MGERRDPRVVAAEWAAIAEDARRDMGRAETDMAELKDEIKTLKGLREAARAQWSEARKRLKHARYHQHLMDRAPHKDAGGGS